MTQPAPEATERERETYICPGCNVREPWGHRCTKDEEDGRMCECVDCNAGRLHALISRIEEAREGSRFLAKVSVAGLDDCWEWTASKNQKGYGQFGVGKKMVKAHRWAYENAIGPIPEGLVLHHQCENPGCVNPHHCSPTTHRHNILMGNGLAAVHARKTHCPKGHPYSGANLYRRPNGDRECRICKRATLRRWRAAALEALKARGE